MIFFGLVFYSLAQEADYDYIACEPDEAKHRNEGNPVEVIFINDYEDKPVVIYWMNARGDKTEYARLSEEEEFPVNTYTNHYWVIEDLWGCLGIIQAKSEGEIHFSEFPKLDRGEDDGDGGGR